jgi:Flp pilus assembly pilin Flp
MLRRFLHHDRGATAIEYTLILSLISVALIYSVTQVGVELGNTFNKVSNTLRDGS